MCVYIYVNTYLFLFFGIKLPTKMNVYDEQIVELYMFCVCKCRHIKALKQKRRHIQKFNYQPMYIIV